MVEVTQKWITLQKFDSFQSIDPDMVAAEHRLDVVILILLVDERSNTRPVLMRSKIPLAFAFSCNRNKPAFDVRFLAAKNNIMDHFNFLYCKNTLYLNLNI
jgi:hypothetical protein